MYHFIPVECAWLLFRAPFQEEFQEKLGTRVHIDRKELGGQIKIDFFSTDDLRSILEMIQKAETEKKLADLPPQAEMLENYIAKNAHVLEVVTTPSDEVALLDDRSKEEKTEDDSKLYDISNFSV